MPDNLALIGQLYGMARKSYDPKSHAKAPEVETVKSGVGITKSNYGAYGEYSEVPLSKIVQHGKTEVKFRMAAFTYMAHCVGQGFHNSADMSTPTGRKAKELLDDFTFTAYDLDTINQKLARDVWASGNGFVHTAGTEEMPLQGIFMLPLSAITAVRRDWAGDPLEFIYTWGTTRNKPLPANWIRHFRWLPWDEEAFGEGIGQILSRKGLGYETEAGNTIKRDSWFTTQEKMDDVSARMVYAGQPRFGVFLDPEKGGDDEIVDDVTSSLNKLDPLQHLVINASGTVSQLSLDTSGKFSDFLRQISDQVLTGTMSPLIRLWSSLDFTYASSQSALEAMDPLISMYQRAHKRFIELGVYYPLVEQYGMSPKKVDPQLNWGKQKKLTVDEIIQLSNLLQQPLFEGRVDPTELLKQVEEVAGVDLTVQKMELTADLTALRQMIKDGDSGKTMKVHYDPKSLPISTKKHLLELTK